MAGNEHKNLIDSQLHNCKGFAGALKNEYLVKNERYLQAWETRNFLPPVIDVVSCNAPPPTEVDGDTYIVDNSTGSLDVNTITWQSGTTVRYVFNGTPDLSVYSTGDFITFKNSGNANNDGTFAITSINNGADWIEILNPLRTSATGDEAADSPSIGSVTDAQWDGAQQNDWVRYNDADDFWYNINAEVSFLCYNVTTGSILKFNGIEWFGEDIDIKKLQVTVSASEAQNSFTTPIEIIPAPGVNKVVVVESIIGRINFGTSAYTTLDMTPKYQGSANIYISFTSLFLLAAADQINYFTLGNGIVLEDNLPVELISTADDPTGDSSFTFTIFYRIVDTPII